MFEIKWVKFLLLIMLVFAAILRSWYGTQLDSFTVDEPYHVVAGVSYIKTGDFRLNPEHPPLTKLWVGLFNKNTFQLRDFEPLKDKFNERNYTEETMYFDNDYQLAQRLSRWAMWSFNGILMLSLMLLVWHFIGFHAAWFVGVLMAIEPTFAAHMPVVMTDLPVAMALGCCVLAALGLFRNWNIKWLLFLALFSGVALAIKFSAITGLLALFISLGLLALRPWRKKEFKLGFKQLATVLVSGLLAVVLLWSTYGFQYHAGNDGSDAFNRSLDDKISDLASPHYQQILTLLDDTHVLPKSYIWGLADTIRAGVEGRGASQNFIWGINYKGEAPWFYWPSVIISKVPIAMQLLIIMSLFLLFYWVLHKPNKDKNNSAVLGLLSVLFLAYSMTLLSSQGTYAGIRHGLPLMVVMMLFCSLCYQWFNKNLIVNVSVGILLVLTLLMTVSEKRLWEYHNEWVGGTENAYKYFLNEGLNLGQRTQEIISFIRTNDLQDENFYRFTWLIEEELKAANINIPTIAKDIDDDNVKGAYSGFHLMGMESLVEWEHWNPEDIAHLERVKRLGQVYIMKGPYQDPRDWAGSMQGIVKKYLMEETNPDWHVVAKRLEQIISIKDYKYDLYLQLGNAYIKTENRDSAISAFKKAHELIDDSKLFKTKVQQQIEILESETKIENVPLLRSDSIE